jgi:hypothetical protein
VNQRNNFSNELQKHSSSRSYCEHISVRELILGATNRLGLGFGFGVIN